VRPKLRLHQPGFHPQKIHDAAIEKVKTKIRHWKPGIPTDPSTTMGAIISKTQFDRVMGYIDAAKKDGARLVTGGGRPTDPALAKGLFIEPTVFADVIPSMRIFKEEIFGPVVSIIKWTDESAMIDQVIPSSMD
jgi:betaine-aldehyde dehydrogenase